MKHDIWTYYYNPFIIGGRSRPMVAEVECTEHTKLGNGYFGYIVTSPLTGRQYVIEDETGAIVGDNIEVVRDDIQHGDPVVMAKQIDDAIKIVKGADRITADEFWNRMQNS